MDRIYRRIWGWTLTPKSEGYVKSLTITNINYREYQGDSFVFESGYRYAYETLFGYPENLLFDAGGALAIHLNFDRMELVEFCADWYIHSYQKA